MTDGTGRRTRRERQAGFTLIELMLAGTLTLMLMLAVGATLSDTLRSADAVNSQIAVNRHAREIFDIMALGGHVTDANTNASASLVLDHHYVFGLRGRSVSAGGTAWSVPDRLMVRDSTDATRRYRFALSRTDADPNDGTVPDHRLMAEEIRDVTATCTDYNLPLVGCGAIGDTITPVRGFLRADPQIVAYTQAKGMVELGLQLTDPDWLNAPRAFSTGGIVPFWTAFNALQGTAPW